MKKTRSKKSRDTVPIIEAVDGMMGAVAETTMIEAVDGMLGQWWGYP
jgi:hypothetical protein